MKNKHRASVTGATGRWEAADDGTLRFVAMSEPESDLKPPHVEPDLEPEDEPDLEPEDEPDLEPEDARRRGSGSGEAAEELVGRLRSYLVEVGCYAAMVDMAAQALAERLRGGEGEEWAADALAWAAQAQPERMVGLWMRFLALRAPGAH